MPSTVIPAVQETSAPLVAGTGYVRTPPPGSKLCIGDSVRLLGIAQGGLQVAMAEPLADGGEAHASVDELRRVGVAQLMQGGVDAGGSRVRTQCSWTD